LNRPPILFRHLHHPKDFSNERLGRGGFASKGLTAYVTFCALGLIVTGCNADDRLDLENIENIEGIDSVENVESNVKQAARTRDAARPNPPYFPLANECTLPDLSIGMAALQSAVMERLEIGFPTAELKPDILEGGIVPSMQCGTTGSIGSDPLKLYLVDHNLIEYSDDNCGDGMAYRGRVSTLDPTYQYGDFMRIECEAMKLVMIGEYDVKLCAKGTNISKIEIVPRADDPTTPGFSLESLTSTCNR